ncbi:MAG: hypothetical protein BMS9Abin01_0171 [Gammaproteobacteria bacterium]|nr:MAG: hypothetical protein BMS9Abin01_0171 [Gammaproteobacteria bacterium]
MWRQLRHLAAVCTLASMTAVRAELIVVANEGAGTLSIIDPDSATLQTLAVGGDPHNLAVTPGGRIIVTQPASGTVSIVDPRAPSVLKRLRVRGRPHGVAVSPEGQWVVVGAEAARELHVVDVERLLLTQSRRIEPAPHNLLVTDTGRVWITALGENALWRTELQDSGLVERLQTTARPHDFGFVRPANALWVANWGSNDVLILNVAPAQMQTTRISGRQPHHVAVTPAAQEVWITNHGSEDLSVISVTRQREVARVAVGKAPHHVAFSQNGRWAYVANNGSSDVSVVDVRARRETARLPAGAGPHGIVVVPLNRCIDYLNTVNRRTD